MVTVKWSLLFFVTVSVFLFTALHSVQAQTEGKQKDWCIQKNYLMKELTDTAVFSKVHKQCKYLIISFHTFFHIVFLFLRTNGKLMYSIFIEI